MENNKIKIIFIGTPEFGRVILEKLCQANMEPVLVVTAPDKPVGRKQIITPTPVKIIAEQYGIRIIQPNKILDSRFQILDSRPDLIVLAAYGQILPQEILDIPKHGCLNVHPSLLPKYRGATPVQSAILNGDKETGVTIILMDAGIDSGAILSQRKTEIGSKETFQQLHDRLAVLGAELLIDTIPDWLDGRIKLQPQGEKQATYTKILRKEDGKIDWRKSPEELDRQIRALNPWPGAYAIHKGKVIKILKARLEKNKLIIEKIQLAGKKPASFQDFLRGHKSR